MTTSPEPDELRIPSTVRRAWGLDDLPTKGPKRGLTLALIVTAGVDLADEEGPAAVSMARIAERLGVSAMGLYRYVPAKDELLGLMVDAALGPSPRASGPDGWRAGLRRWATAERARYLGHPWVVSVPIQGPPILPNQLAWLDDALQCLADTGLSEQEKLSTALFVSGFVRNATTLSIDIAASASDSIGRTWGAVVAQLLDPADLPGLARALASGSMDDDEDDDGLDDEFTWGLARALDGIEHLIDERQARAGSRAKRPAGR
jgi:AcrR family transcriptional regulator